MGKQLFYLSLIILSIAMGINWYKNRPKPAPKQPKPSVAVNLDDLQIATGTGPITQGPDGTGSASLAVGEVASETSPGVASSTVSSASAEIAEGSDPILQAFEAMNRNPFEPSPFVAMMARAGKTEVNADGKVEEKKIKPTSVIPSAFSGTIETPTQLVAIMDSRVYKAGDDFNGRTIKTVGTLTVTLEDDLGIYLMPKKGVALVVASDGKVLSINDGFRSVKGSGK